MEDFWLLKCNINNDIKNVSFNDIYTDDGGNLQVVSGLDALKQLVSQALWLWYGEYDFNTTIGVTYRRLMSNKFSRSSLFQFQIQKAIMSINEYIPAKYIPIYGIKKVIIQSYNIDNKKRILSVVCDIILNSSSRKLQVAI